MSKRSKRLRLYRAAKQSISSLDSSFQFFLCPLCLRGLSDYDGNGDDLTLEDVPPKSQGGRPLLVTCRDCNNTAGTKIENDLVQKNKLTAAIQAVAMNLDEVSNPTRAAFPAVLKIGADKINCGCTVFGKNLTIDIHNKHNSDQAIDSLKTLVPHQKFTLTPNYSFNPIKANAALLKTAYLFAFAKFGYSFILNRGLNLVRQQIHDPIGEHCRFIVSHTENIQEGILVDNNSHLVSVTLNNQSIVFPCCESSIFFKKTPSFEQRLELSGEHYSLPTQAEFLQDQKWACSGLNSKISVS